MRRFPVLCSLLLLATVTSLWAGADSAAAVDLVDKAAEFVAENGVDKALAVISDSAGPFVKGELYVFAYDTAAVMKAHPKNAKLIGKDLLNIPDVDGVLFRKEIVEKARSTGTGWVDYKYKNPVSGQIEPKTTYLKKAGTLVLCCGIYKP